MNFKDSIKVIFSVSVFFFLLSGIGAYAYNRIPEEGDWIILKMLFFMCKINGIVGGGIFALMAVMMYTGYHHKKKAGAKRLFSHFLFGGYILILCALGTILLASHMKWPNVLSFGLFGLGAIGIILIILTFFFSGAAKRPEDED